MHSVMSLVYYTGLIAPNPQQRLFFMCRLKVGLFLQYNNMISGILDSLIILQRGGIKKGLHIKKKKSSSVQQTVSVSYQYSPVLPQQSQLPPQVVWQSAKLQSFVLLHDHCSDTQTLTQSVMVRGVRLGGSKQKAKSRQLMKPSSMLQSGVFFTNTQRSAALRFITRSH